MDQAKGTIEVLSLNKLKRAIIQNYSGQDKPTSMALVPSRGEMFVSLQSSDHYHIDRQAMKGGNDHLHVVESGLSQKGPIKIVVDEADERVYWMDGYGKLIEKCDFNGMNRKTVTNLKKAPSSMALVKDDLYWTTVGSKSLQWRPKNEPRKSGKTTVLDRPLSEPSFPDFINVVAGTPLKFSSHPCMNNNGNCSDICLSDGPNIRVCLCETGRLFKDGKKESCIDRWDCGFRCSSSDECLELSQRCDGKADCLDQSDELNCAKEKELHCDATQFKCKDGTKCIPLSQRCDKHFNCGDNSDELNCNNKEACRSNQMQCTSGACIDVTQRCDGEKDCEDGSDESSDICNSVECPKDFFKCSSGQCIPKSFECNGHVDCSDASDEHTSCSKFRIDL